MPSVESVYFYQVPRSTLSRSQVRYASGNGEPVQIVEVKAPGAPFLTFTTRQEGKDVVLEVGFEGRKVPAGSYRGVEQATVRFTNGRLTQLPLNIQWDLKPAIVSTPLELVFQDTAGKELRQKVTLKHAEGRPFRITSASCSLPGLRVEGLNQKAASQELTVVLPASVKTGRYSEVLALVSDDPDQPELSLRVLVLLKKALAPGFPSGPGASGDSLEGCPKPAGLTSLPSSPWRPSPWCGPGASLPPSTACRRGCPWGPC